MKQDYTPELEKNLRTLEDENLKAKLQKADICLKETNWIGDHESENSLHQVRKNSKQLNG